MYGEVVQGVDGASLRVRAHGAQAAPRRERRRRPRPPKTSRELIETYLQAIFRERTGEPFPQDAARAAPARHRGRSSSPGRARAPRSTGTPYEIPDDLGTAVNVGRMVFGNKDEGSGDRRLLHPQPVHRRDRAVRRVPVNAQGEDVVAGIRTPEPIDAMAQLMPEALRGARSRRCERLERHYRDMQDIEFTIEDGHLYLLQTRVGKRTAAAAVKIGRRRWSTRA